MCYVADSERIVGDIYGHRPGAFKTAQYEDRKTRSLGLRAHSRLSNLRRRVSSQVIYKVLPGTVFHVRRRPLSAILILTCLAHQWSGAIYGFATCYVCLTPPRRETYDTLSLARC